MTPNLNERILKLWKSTRPSGTWVDETNFFTPSDGLRQKIFNSQKGKLTQGFKPRVCCKGIVPSSPLEAAELSNGVNGGLYKPVIKYKIRRGGMEVL